MIKFKPVSYKELGEPFCSDETLNGYIGYDLSDNGSLCGKCAFRLKGYSMEITYVEASGDDPETIEGLIRSALNFGGNRNVYMADFIASDGIDVAKSLGFENIEGVYSGDIPTLLQGSCCKGK